MTTSTINGYSLNIESISIKSAHNHIYTSVPGTAANSIYDMGYEGLKIKISGWELTSGEYQMVIDQLMREGQQSLIIIDGWEYRVYIVDVDRTIDSRANYYPWTAQLTTEDPYLYSTDDTTRSKIITSDHQTWTADDSGYPIINSQVANTTADVEVIGIADDDIYTSHIRYEDLIDSTIYEIYHSTGYVLISTQVHDAEPYHAVVLHDASAYIQGDEGSTSGLIKVTYQIEGESEHDYCELSNGSSDYVLDSYAGDIVASLGHYITIRWYGMASAAGTFARCKDLYSRVSMRRRLCTTSPAIYNTAYTSSKCTPCNRLPQNAVARVNVDGTGIWSYEVGFDSHNVQFDSYKHKNISVSSSECVFANNSYLYIDVDCKFPIVGIPTITAHYSGTGGSCYIDGYQIPSWTNGGAAELDTSTYHLAGKTSFQLQFKCTTSVNFKIQDFKIEIDTNAGSAVFPVIVGGSVTNTMKCDHATGSSDKVSVGLSYYERRWG